MDIERVFMSCYKIKEEPDDIFNLIELALRVGAFKYPEQFQKRKARIIKFLMHPSITSGDDYDDDHDHDDDDDGDDDHDDEEEEEVIDAIETQQHQKPLTKKIKLVIKKTVQVAPLKKQNNCNAITATKESGTELKKTSETDLVQQLDDADKQETLHSHNTTTMASRKRMSLMDESKKRVQVAPPSVKQLLSDFSFEKQLDGDKQLQKQSHKDFKKMENDHDTKKKKEEGAQQTPTQCRRKECITGSTKSMLPPLMKMNVEVAPPPHPKQSNCSSITRPMQKTSQSSAIARPKQKETQSVSDMKKKFESSKRKFEERLVEQREAKRRIVMVDFHHMPKPANDPRAPKRCWDRKRF